MLGPLYPSQVMLVIDAAVTNVEDLSSLEEYLASLGKKHRAVGVRLGSFSVGSGVFSCSRVAGTTLSQPPHPPKSTGPLYIATSSDGRKQRLALVTCPLCD